MQKTRFYQLTQSELILLRHFLSTMKARDFNNNLESLNKEINEQININEWNAKEFEIRNEIDKCNEQINNLKSMINIEIKKIDDYLKLLNK